MDFRLLFAVALVAAMHSPLGIAGAQPLPPVPVAASLPAVWAEKRWGAALQREVMSDSAAPPDVWPRGLRGALIGGGAGLAFGIYAARALCERDCGSFGASADRIRVVGSSVLVGAAAGALVEVLLTRSRRAGSLSTRAPSSRGGG